MTLLGQNVNSYGVEFGDRLAFGKLLRACGEIDGLERVRFTSPHPKDFTDDVIAAMAETPNVCPQLHMPLQSGSDRGAQGDAPLLPPRALPRHHRQGPRGDAGRRDHHRHHRRLPRRDRGGLRRPTLDVVREARFASAFTFQYSKRPGTPAADLDDQMPKAVVQERYERLVDLAGGDHLGGEQAAGRPTVEVLVAVGEGRKDGATGRLSGRARDSRLVHFTPPAAERRPARRHRRRSRSPTPPRTTSSPTAPCSTAAPGPATPGRPPGPTRARGRGGQARHADGRRPRSAAGRAGVWLIVRPTATRTANSP